MDWTRFEVTLPTELQEALSDFFIEQGSDGVVLEDRDSDTVAIIAYFPGTKQAKVSSALDAYISNILEFFPNAVRPRITVDSVPDERWALAWKDFFKPVPIGRKFLITPPWLAPDPGNRTVIVIEPAEAFGTGTHETSQSCIVLLEHAIAHLALKGQQWTMIDVGCGSGILAFAGCRLGANAVIGVDIDPKAVASAVRNAKLNGICEEIRFVCGSIDSIKTEADVVAANLDYRTLTTYSHILAQLAGKALVISGVSVELWLRARSRFEQQGLCLEKEILSKEWGSGLFLVRRKLALKAASV